MRRFSAILFVWLVLGTCCFAQVFRGAIGGVVQDPQGASIPGATVEIKSPATGQIYKTVSSSAGDYLVQDLPLGDYTVTVTFPGFANLKFDMVRVSAGTVFELPVKLAMATSATTIEVDAAALTLDTTTQVQNYSLPKEEVQSIPLNGRSFTSIVNLLPGSTGGAVNGRAGANYMIDGMDNNDGSGSGTAANQGGVGGVPGELIPIDSIDEFSAQTSFGAEAGRYAGAAINLSIKSGTNKIHGSLYYFNRNEFFAAINPFTEASNVANGTSVGKPKIRFQEYGGSIGGPILKDKLFYFTNYERQQYILGQGSSQQTEPSNAWITQSTAFVKLLGGTVNPIAAPLLNTLLQPNMLAAPATLNNFLPIAAQTGYSNNLMTKVDYNINAKNHISGRWYWGQGSQTAPKGSLNPWYWQVAGAHVHNFAVIFNTTFSASLTNQLTMGVDYYNQPFSDANPNINAAAVGFVTGTGPGDVAGAPTLSMSGFTDGGGQSPFSARHDFSAPINDTVSLSLGKHQIRTGGEYRRLQVFEVGDGAGGNGGTRGAFSFSGNRGINAANGATAPSSSQYSTKCSALGAAICSSSQFTYNGVVYPVASTTALYTMSDFMQFQSSTSTMVNGDLDRVVSMNNFNLFVSDAYQVTQSLNLNLGLRWDYQSPVQTSSQDLSVFNPSIAANPLAPGGGLAVVGAPAPYGVSKPYNASALQLGPRVGLSWAPTIFPSVLKNTVVRASFGIYFDTTSLNGWVSSPSSGLDGNPAGTKPTYNQTLTNPNLGFFLSSPQGSIFPTSPILPGKCTTTTATYSPTTNTCPVVSIPTVNQNYTVADTPTYSLNIERSFGNAVIAQLGYVGTQGKHLQNTYDINQTAFGAGLTAPPANTIPAGSNAPYIVNGVLPLQYNRPYYNQFPNYGKISQINSAALENFNSLQALIKTRNWHGLISEFSYTWSHNLGTPTAVPTDNTNPKLDYGNLSNDIREQVKGYFLYDLPGLRSGPKWLTNNWQVTGAIWFHTGKPITATSTSAVGGAGLGEGGDRASLTGNPLYCSSGATGCTALGTSKSINWAFANKQKYIQWFNPGAISSPAALTYGSTRVGQFYGPGYEDVDLSLFKIMPVGERAKLQFRAEMFNLFNRYNFSNPTFTTNTLATGNVAGVSTGQITSTSGGSSAPGIGAGEPFNIQLALKILF